MTHQYRPIKYSLGEKLLHGFNQIVNGFPSIISFEVSKACNRRCSYCPQSIAPERQQIVSPIVWSKFIQRLQEYRWDGRVGFIDYNELSLVPKSEQYIKDVSEAGCRPIVYSNGDFPEVIQKWIDSGAAYIVITKHQPSKPEWQTGIDKLLEHPDNHRLITVREILKPDNRGGLVEGSGNERLRIFNAIPFITVPRCWTHTSGMVIGTDGTVAICTLDYHKQTNFGNIMTSSIEQIWDGQLKAARKMSRSGKPATDICVACLK